MLSLRRHKTLAAALLFALSTTVAYAGTFNYHGQLTDSGRGANGRYDIQISVYPSQTAAIPSAPATTVFGVDVHNGSFSTELDLGNAVQKGSYIGVAVRPAGGHDFVALSGRTAVAPDGTCPDAWLIGGNAGTSGSDYVGTTDAENFHVGVDGGYSANFYVGGGVSLAPFVAETPAGSYATSMSLSNGAAGAYSIAGGFNAGTVNEGSIVFADHGGIGGMVDTAPDQFIISATGGTIVNGNTLVSSSFDDFVIYPRHVGGDADADLVLATGSGNYARIFESNSAGVLYISSTNGVHIDNPVEIEGDVKAANIHAVGAISASTAANAKAPSDARIKQNIEPVSNALDTLSQLHFVSFEYTPAWLSAHPEIAQQRYYNVVAQQFQRVFPDAVSGSGEYLPGADKTPANEVLQVDTYPAQIVTMAAVQELAQKNAALQKTVDRLTARLEKLEAAQGQ
jgi:uncharacterized small protein (DUF1192 family)